MVAAVPVISTPAIDIGMMKIKENDHEQGALPDGSYGVNTMTEFCCRSDCNADTEFFSSNRAVCSLPLSGHLPEGQRNEQPKSLHTI